MNLKQGANKLKPSVAIEFLKKIKSGYENSLVVDANFHAYKVVWLSPGDIKAIDCALDALKKIDEIADIAEGYRTDNPKEPYYDTEVYMDNIIEVLKNDEATSD